MNNRKGDAWADRFFARGGAWVLGQGFMFVLTLLVPVRTGVDAPALQTAADWLAVFLIASGGLAAFGGLLALGKSLSPFPRPLHDGTLHDRGLYALVRHPVYAGLIVAACGWTWWWHSNWGWWCCLAMAVFLDRKAAREEIWLREKYPAYAAYARRVKRLLPWIY